MYQSVTVLDDVPIQDVAAWRAGLGELFDRLAGCFGRVETRKWARAYLTGLRAPVERKNGRQSAEAAGVAEPTGIQHFVDRARWDADAVRDAVRSYLAQALAGPQGVLVVDEIGFLKKGGRLSAGPAPVLGHGRASGELPARCVLGLRRTPRAGVDRPGAVSTPVLDR